MEGCAQTFRRRRGYVYCALLVAFAAFAVRLAYIQVFQHPAWRALAERMEAATVPLEPQRGLILDRNGHGLAVTSRALSIFINPRAVPQDRRDEVAAVLSRMLKLDAGRVAAILSHPKYFAWIKRKVTTEEAEAVRRADLPGVGFRDESRRCYPNGALLAHVLGFVGTDGQGLEGLEAQFDSLLAGTPGEEVILRDGLGRRLCSGERDASVAAPRGNDERSDAIRPAVNGRSLVLTVDMRLQRIVEEELAETCAKNKPDGAAAIVMDPWKGDILAMAVWPTFDPARFAEASHSVCVNRTVTECLEPGSTFKPFVASAALEAGVVTPDTVFDCHHGVYRIGSRVLHDAHGYGRLTVRDIIAYSSNIGMAQVGARAGAERVYRALSDFGFGRKCGVELPGESAGLLHPLNRWSKLTLSSIPMGQEVAVSPLQLTAGFCVFANGGWHVRPRIILGVADAEGRRMIEPAGPPVYRRVLSEKTARLMCGDLLAGVVERGTAKASAIEGYRMAGKTGTGQLARVNARGYEPGAYSSAFVGIAPVESPRFVIGVVLKRPKGGSHYGGVVAAPAVGRMAERILSTYRVPRLAAVPGPAPLALKALNERSSDR